ncbi:MAG: LysM peptidoglycan-binding domain-containing protein [Anaerolineales bacterium]
MTQETPSKPTKLCPTCGTRLSDDAIRCLVCGTDLTSSGKSSKTAKAVQRSRIPVVTVNLPLALGLLALFIAIGATLVYFAMRQPTAQAVAPTDTPTVTVTPTASASPTPVTPTVTFTPIPSPTPFSYVVKLGDTCSTIAFNFGVSIQSIVLLNELPAACDTLFEGQTLLIPQPTPTPTALPTATLSSAEATDAACAKIEYTVQDNDTLSSISLNYAVSIAVLKSYNGRVNDTVRSGETIVIPLCERASTPGPSPTPTPPPPYPAPNLLLPADGAPFTAGDSTVTLQWASVGTLRSNEVYMVTVMDVTEGLERKIVEYMPDTKFVVPVSFRPQDTNPHVIRWWVQPVRQTGTDDDGNPIWESAGAESAERVFTWMSGGSSSQQATPTP